MSVKKLKVGLCVLLIVIIVKLNHDSRSLAPTLLPGLTLPLGLGLRRTTRRGGGILTIHSGCRMSKWVYPSSPKVEKYGCKVHPTPGPDISQLLYIPSQLEENDTVFVPLTEVERFVNDMLDGLSTNIVVISGNWMDVEPPSNTAIYKLLTNPHVLKWFAQNLPKYGGANPFHPKIAPFPYGLLEAGTNPIFPAYKEILFGNIQNGSNKTNFIFAGPLGKHGNGKRTSIPQRELMRPRDYFLQMSKSTYVLSPDGDRPECYRHYEAIGLGTVPITELDPFFFRHLGSSGSNGPVIFGNKIWNLTVLENELDPNPFVKRSMIWEDYWMDWVDDVVGFRLHWNTFESGNGLTDFENSLLVLLD
jgi:hypothetical protein